MRVLGVDGGLDGAAAIIEIVDGVDGTAPKLVDVTDIPVLGTAAKTGVDAIGLRNWIESLHPDFAGVERAIPMLLVEPSKWKRALHLNSDKEAARQLAIGLFPHAHAQLNLKRHHQRAEAMLIALFTANNRGAP